MIQKFLTRFGYIKIPLAAIELSKQQESCLATLQRAVTILNRERGKRVGVHLEQQKRLTRFLETGVLAAGQK